MFIAEKGCDGEGLLVPLGIARVQCLELQASSALAAGGLVASSEGIEVPPLWPGNGVGLRSEGPGSLGLAELRSRSALPFLID